MSTAAYRASGSRHVCLASWTAVTGERWGRTLQGRSKRWRCDCGACTASSCLGSAGQRRCFNRRRCAPARVPEPLALDGSGVLLHTGIQQHVVVKLHFCDMLDEC